MITIDYYKFNFFLIYTVLDAQRIFINEKITLEKKMILTKSEDSYHFILGLN